MISCIGEFLFGISDLHTLDLPFSRPGEAILGPKGSSVHSSHQISLYSSFVNAFESLQVVIPLRGPRGNLWPLWEIFGDVGESANREIDNFVGPLVEKALEDKKETEKGLKDEEEGSLLEHIAGSTDDVKIIRDEVGYTCDECGSMLMVTDSLTVGNCSSSLSTYCLLPETPLVLGIR